MLLPCSRHVLAVLMPCPCHALAMLLPCSYHARPLSSLSRSRLRLAADGVGLTPRCGWGPCPTHCVPRPARWAPVRGDEETVGPRRSCPWRQSSCKTSVGWTACPCCARSASAARPKVDDARISNTAPLCPVSIFKDLRASFIKHAYSETNIPQSPPRRCSERVPFEARTCERDVMPSPHPAPVTTR